MQTTPTHQIDERVRRVRLPPRAEAERLVPRVVRVLPATLRAEEDAAVGALHMELLPSDAALAVWQHNVTVVGEPEIRAMFYHFSIEQTWF